MLSSIFQKVCNIISPSYYDQAQTKKDATIEMMKEEGTECYCENCIYTDDTIDILIESVFHDSSPNSLKALDIVLSVLGPRFKMAGIFNEQGQAQDYEQKITKVVNFVLYEMGSFQAIYIVLEKIIENAVSVRRNPELKLEVGDDELFEIARSILMRIDEKLATEPTVNLEKAMVVEEAVFNKIDGGRVPIFIDNGQRWCVNPDAFIFLENISGTPAELNPDVMELNFFNY